VKPTNRNRQPHDNWARSRCLYDAIVRRGSRAVIEVVPFGQAARFSSLFGSTPGPEGANRARASVEPTAAFHRPGRRAKLKLLIITSGVTRAGHHKLYLD
jgi:hypothetical protein